MLLEHAGVELRSRLGDLRRQAIRDGLEPLRIGGARKVITGITSLDEVLRVAPVIELG